MATTNSRFQRRYPAEMRERAVRMVREAIAESGERVGVVTRVARQLGIGPESLRNWVKQAEIDNGKRPGVTTAEQQRIAELEREVRELRRANEILKAASAFFASGSSTRDCRGSREVPSRSPRALGCRADL
jgi:transposase